MRAETAQGEALIAQVDQAIEDFLHPKLELLAQISPQLTILGQLARSFTSGGKRLRPGFCVWGYLSAAPAPQDPGPLIRVAASLDLFHVAELVHDDVMDSSDTRRGQPSAHRQLERWHHAKQLSGSASEFGEATAIILGDLLGKWAVELFAESAFPSPALGRARRYLQEMSTEVSAGQFLDMLGQACDPRSARSAFEASWAMVERVVEYKTSRYTVIRPLQIGAALAGATSGLLGALESYGSAVGRAFQYRDDVLGVFGDPEQTGKPAGDDLREGKLTALATLAMRLCTPEQASQLAVSLGRPDLDEVDIAALREIITGSGALEATEAAIEDALDIAIRAIRREPSIRPASANALAELAYSAANRDR
jgi:geranylgeranyl diphosphate synthase type I